MPSNSSRMNKINEELKKQISHIINTELHDPNLTGLITVTNVKTTPDLRYARVYVSIINSKSNYDSSVRIKDTTAEKKTDLAILKKSSGFIRSELARIVNLRTTPEIIFEFDDSIEYGAKIDQIIKNIIPK